jgi:hypothetical protein
MKKKKMFLSSTDIHQITGLCMRSARNMMQYIRIERHLGKHQVVSIYDFSHVFHLPVHVVFVYVNTNLFNKDSIDLDVLKRDYEQQVLESGDMSYLYHKDFDLFMTPKDLKKIEQDTDDVLGVNGAA